MARWSLASLALALSTACGGGTDKTTLAVERASEAAWLASRVFAFSTTVYTSSTIATIAPYDVIAQSIRGRFGSETNGCATVGGTGAVATLMLPSPGCVLGTSGMTLAGMVSCEVKDGPDPYLQIACAFDVKTHDQPFAATLDIFTENGSSYTFAQHVTYVDAWTNLGTIDLTLPAFNAGFSAQTATMSGTGTLASDGALTLNAIAAPLGDCRALESGTLTHPLGTITISEGQATLGQRTLPLPRPPGCP